jgi:hypothetical protein
MNSWVLSDTSASLDNDMDHAHVFYISCTMVLLLENGFGSPVSIYCVKVGHSFLWCPYVLHVVHQTTSLFSFPYSGLVEM